MTDALTWLLVLLNALANAVGAWVLSPIQLVPGWLSATVIAIITGVLLLAAFKYTSNQSAIQRARSDISANLLALKLFKDSARVAVRSQGRVLLGAGRLFILALAPMVVMAGPVMLLLGQLSLWYQQRPLRVGEEAVVTLRLNGQENDPVPAIHLQPTEAMTTTIGPVRIQSRREVCWNIQARTPGQHKLVFQVGDRTFDKDLAVGDGFMRVSARRPDWRWSDILEYPMEEPFLPDSPVHSIDITYPERTGWLSGSNTWMIYWFIASMVAGFCFRRVLNVQV